MTFAPAAGAVGDETRPTAAPPQSVIAIDPVDPKMAKRSTDIASLYEQAGLNKTAPATSRRASAAAASAGPVLPPGIKAHVGQSCTGTGTDGDRVQVMYVRETDMADRYAAVAPLLLNEAKYIDDVFALSAMTEGSGKRVRWVTDSNCNIVVQNVVLPDGALTGAHGVTETAMNNAGLLTNHRKYLAFADVPMGGMGGMACGQGTMYADSSPTNNPNDGRYPQMARIDRECWVTAEGYNAVPLHELMHTFGAVQGDSPHGSAGGHCSDAEEVMCYNDGTIETSQVCPEAQRAFLDCNRDDYFNAAPAAGSYLATHWNTATSSFLNTVAVLPAPPSLSVTASATAPTTGERVTFTANVSAGTTVNWDTDVPECETGAATTGITFEIVCFNEAHPTVTATASGSAVTTRTVETTIAYGQGAYPDLQVSHPASAFHSTPFTLTAAMANTNAAYTYKWTLNTSGCTSSNGSTNANLNATCAASTQGTLASFTVKATRVADGAIEVRTVGVQIAAAGNPTATIEGPTELVAGQTATFTAVVTNGVSSKYTWASLNAFPATGATTATFKVTPPAASTATSDTVYVEVTNTDGRKGATSFTYQIVAPLKVSVSAPKKMAPGTSAVVTAAPSRDADITWTDNQTECTVVKKSVADLNALLSCVDGFTGPVAVTATATDEGEVASASKTVTVTTGEVVMDETVLSLSVMAGFPTLFTVTLTDKSTGARLAGRTIDMERRGDGEQYVVFDTLTTDGSGKAQVAVPEPFFVFNYKGAPTVAVDAAFGSCAIGIVKDYPALEHVSVVARICLRRVWHLQQ